MIDNPQKSNSHNRQQTLPLLGLIAAGLAGNYFKFPLFLNIDFLFGSIFALLALQLRGLGGGLLAGLVISGYTYVLWNHPYAIVIMTAEVAAVGWLSSRRHMGLVLADTLYWLCLGMPLVYLFYHGVMQVPLGNTSIVMVKQAVNGIANALTARLLFTIFALRSDSTKVPFRELTCNLLIAFVLFPALLMLGINSRTDFTETDRNIRQALLRDSRQMADSLQVWTRNRSLPIIALAKLAQTLPPVQMQARLEQTLASDRNFLRIGLHNQDAITVAYSPLVDELGRPNIGRGFADRPFIPELKRSLKPMLSEVLLARVGTPKPIVHVLVPVLSQGRYNGYVLGALNLQRVQDIFRINAAETKMFYTLLDKNSMVIASNRPQQQPMTPLDRGRGELRPIDGRISQWVPFLPPNTPMTERWTKSSYVAETSIGALAEWRLILEQPVAPFQKHLYRSYTREMIILFLMLLVSLALAELLSRKVLTSLQKLQDVTSDLPSKIATNAEIAWPASGILETDNLITNYRAMASSLAAQFREIRQINDQLEARISERTRELRDNEAFTRDVLDSLTAHIAVLDRDGAIVLVNDPWKRFALKNGRGDVGASDIGKQYLATCQASIGQKDDDGAEAARAGIAAVLSGKQQRFSLEYPCHSPTERRWFIMRVSALQGRRTGAVISHANITARKQAEETILNLNTRLEGLVAKRTAELAQTNRDLHNFCYAISHELRAPVARLKGFSQLLQEVSAADHPAEAQHCAERIVAASDLLQQVIDAVLQLSRLTKTSIVPEPLNLSDLAREVAAELISGAPERRVELIVADGLLASGDPRLMRLCLTNLLGNAVKYTARKPLARIEFGMDAGRGALFVRDNGIGFDMAHAGKLFEPFLRLHSAQEFSGTGVGLALVQRIIELHGGRIWAEAAPDQGAAFFFTLAPLPDPDLGGEPTAEALPTLCGFRPEKPLA